MNVCMEEVTRIILEGHGQNSDATHGTRRRSEPVLSAADRAQPTSHTVVLSKLSVLIRQNLGKTSLESRIIRTSWPNERGIHYSVSDGLYDQSSGNSMDIHTVNLERRTRLCYKYINIARQYDSNWLLYHVLTLKSGGTPRLGTL